MKEQVIISIGREFGSGGHEIAEKLAEMYQLPLYDHKLLDEIAASTNLDKKEVFELDEKKRNKIFSRTVRGLNNSPEHNIAQLQFEYIKKLADEGKSFVIVGRCSESVLKGHEALISFFIYGEEEARVHRVVERYKLTYEYAKELIADKDKKRAKYHDNHFEAKWGDSHNYDVTLNSSKLGIAGTKDIMAAYIDARRAMK